jgi:hypothetical protein
MASAVGTNGELAIVGGLWAQYWAQAASSSQYKDFDSYSISSTTFYVNSSYSTMYAGALLDLQSVIEKAKAKQDWRYYLMAITLKAYTYQVLVDLYDKVPYTKHCRAINMYNLSLMMVIPYIKACWPNWMTLYQKMLATLNRSPPGKLKPTWYLVPRVMLILSRKWKLGSFCQYTQVENVFTHGKYQARRSRSWHKSFN